MAYKFASSPDHSYLQTALGNVPDWDATDYTTIHVKVRTTGAVAETGATGVVQLVHEPGTEDEANHYLLVLVNTGTTNRLQWIVSKNDVETILYSTFEWAHANTDWHTIIAVANRDNYTLHLSVDGAVMESYNCTKWPTTDLWYVGVSAGGIFQSALDGDVAELAIWDTPILSAFAAGAADINALNKGFSPKRIRPGNLLAYWPLVRNIGSVWKEAYPFTAYNSPVVAAHPPVIG